MLQYGSHYTMAMDKQTIERESGALSWILYAITMDKRNVAFKLD